MTVKLELLGVDSLLKRFDEASLDVRQKGKRFTNKIATKIRASAAESIAQNSQGNTYPRGGGETHVASTAGNPPNKDSGDLKRSIFTRPKKSSLFRNYVVEVVSPMKYSRALEFGTKDGRIRPRPFMRPALAKHSKEYYNGLRKILREAVD